MNFLSLNSAGNFGPQHKGMTSTKTTNRGSISEAYGTWFTLRLG